MTPLDDIIHKTLDGLPKPRNLDAISRAVEKELPAKLRIKLTPPSSVALYRLIRRRVRAILRHMSDRPQMLPGIQDHYSTKTKDVWEGVEEMSLETAMWNLERIDRRRRAAEAEYAALTSWIREKFPAAKFG